uniref:Gamma-glutamyltransferase n=1 Tax=Roseihalotalea indica TaxID=2867963 RepID=A0AA49JGG0_9BACT|nr:gamma-glutamyltransferase [Tunicatimonas sp. TK19036]
MKYFRWTSTGYLALFVSFLLACQSSTDQQKPTSETELSQTDTSPGGMVSAAHPLATKAGVEMLRQGGNAVDAAVASAFALAVVEPSMSGLGGRLQAIVRLPDGTVKGVDATTQAPLTYDAATAPKAPYGYATIGIPGVVAGLTKLLADYGSLPLSTVIQPAIGYAENGYELLPMAAARHHSQQDRLKEFAGSSKYFLKADSSTYAAGELFVQKDLANTLRQIADGGGDAFYKGAIAEKIAQDMEANGGIITQEDLAGYEARDAEVLHSEFEGYDVYGLSMPSYGAITLEILNLIEQMPEPEDEDDWAANLYQAMELGYQDRRHQTEDSIPILITDEYAQALLAGTSETTALKSNNSTNIPASWRAEMGHTTHLSTADSSGMMVALTQSLGPNMGSKVATDGLGFLYAVTLGGYLGEFEPGQRAASHISPMVLSQGDEPFLALGAAGGSRIPTAIVSVISRVVDQQKSLEEALALPRVYADEDTVLLEMHSAEGWNDETVKAIEAHGFNVKEIAEEARFGRVHAVIYNPETKTFTGVADPDWEGAAGAPE